LQGNERPSTAAPPRDPEHEIVLLGFFQSFVCCVWVFVFILSYLYWSAGIPSTKSTSCALFQYSSASPMRRELDMQNTRRPRYLPKATRANLENLQSSRGAIEPAVVSPTCLPRKAGHAANRGFEQSCIRSSDVCTESRGIVTSLAGSILDLILGQ